MHFFLLEQDGEVTLIDAGLSGYRDTLEPALAEMGRSIDDVKAIVLTHADPDHVGLPALQQTHGVPVYVHRSDSERTRQGKTKQTEGSPGHARDAQARPQPPRAAPHDRQRRSQAVQGPRGAYESLSRIEELKAHILYFGHGDPSMLGTRAIVADDRAKR